jgi:hypothetical protein
VYGLFRVPGTLARESDMNLNEYTTWKRLMGMQVTAAYIALRMREYEQEHGTLPDDRETRRIHDRAADVSEQWANSLPEYPASSGH